MRARRVRGRSEGAIRFELVPPNQVSRSNGDQVPFSMVNLFSAHSHSPRTRSLVAFLFVGAPIDSETIEEDGEEVDQQSERARGAIENAIAKCRNLDTDEFPSCLH